MTILKTIDKSHFVGAVITVMECCPQYELRESIVCWLIVTIGVSGHIQARFPQESFQLRRGADSPRLHGESG